MAVTDEMLKSVEPLARKLAAMNNSHKVNRAITDDGRVILEGRDYLPVRSPDGSTWRIRVDNAGVISATKET